MESTSPKRRFPPPWRVEYIGADCFHEVDANGIVMAVVHCRDDLQKWSFGHKHLTSDEARRVANAIARLPELLAQRRGFHPMPVILTTPDEVEAWMTAPADEALKLQRPLPDGALRIVARGVKEDAAGTSA